MTQSRLENKGSSEQSCEGIKPVLAPPSRCTRGRERSRTGRLAHHQSDGFAYVANKKFFQQGYVVLLSVVLLGAIGLTVAISLILLGLGGSRTGFSEQQSLEARALADSCAETALDSLRQDSGFAGNQTLTIGNGNCTINAVQFDGTVYTIQSFGVVGNVTRRLLVSAQRQTDPSVHMELISWQEVADF